jgi:peptide chain release factor 3
LERIPSRFPRWVTGPAAAIERVASESSRMLLFDAKGQPLILFKDQWALRWALERETEVKFHEVAP